MAEDDDIILRTDELTKHYGGVQALERADFFLRKGEHVAIVGDNGAGKSTLVRMISGVEQPTSGKIYFDNGEVSFANPIEAKEAGVETVFQDLALADDLDVPSNIFLGRELKYFNLGPFSILNEKLMMRKSKEVLQKTGIKIPDLKNAIGNMSGGQRQCVAISRSASFVSKLIIMDEPTAALGRAGNRPGRKHHSRIEEERSSFDPDQPQLAASFRSRRQDMGVPPRTGRGSVDAAKTDGNEIVSLITGVKSTVESNANHV